MTKIQLKLGIALAAAALSVAGVSIVPGVARADHGGYPQPSEWDALMDYLKAIAANEAQPTPADPAQAPTPAETAPAPPAAPVEAPAPVPPSPVRPASGAVQPAAIALPSTGTGVGVDTRAPMLATMLGAAGIAAIARSAFLRRRV